MKPKPRHLGPEWASQFKDKSVVDAYQFRYPYPQETFVILSSLIREKQGTILDAGCGSGFIARNLTDYAERIDAVDFSGLMIEKGKSLPNGDNPKINWIHGTLEEALLIVSVNL